MNRLKLWAAGADEHRVKAFRILVVSLAMLVIGGSPVVAQDSAYPPRLIVVSVSDSSVEVGAPFTVAVDGCDIGQTVDFRIEAASGQAECVQPPAEQSAFVLTVVPGRAEAELTAPGRVGDYTGSATIGSSDGAFDLDFDLQVVDAVPPFAPTSAQEAPIGSGSAFSSSIWMLLTFVLGLGLASGFWVVAQRRD